MAKWKIWLIVIAVIIALVLLIVISWYFIARANRAAETSNQTQETTTSSSATVAEKFAKKLFFIHHSTGEVYWNGGLEKALTDAGYEAAAPWWDPETNPPDFYPAFTNTDQWQTLDPYSIIVFKSCFPASDITSDEMLEQYKAEYTKLYYIYTKYPNKLFVPLSTPPLLKSHTTTEAAQRALNFEDWLVNEYKNGYSGNNLAPFKLHSLLSDSEGYLASDFISSQDDDHPNAHAGEVVGPALVSHLAPFVQ